MSEHVKIREPLREELPKVVTLYNLMWTQSENPLDVRWAESFFETVQKQPSQFMYVAEKDGRIVGAFMLLIRNSQPAGADPEGVLENVVVHPKFRGRESAKR